MTSHARGEALHAGFPPLDTAIDSVPMRLRHRVVPGVGPLPLRSPDRAAEHRGDPRSQANTTGHQWPAMRARFTSTDVGILKSLATIPYATGADNTEIDTAPFRTGVAVHNECGPVINDDE